MRSIGEKLPIEKLIELRTALDESNAKAFLEMTAVGTLSGQVCEWPQLPRAAKWALSTIDTLYRELLAARKRIAELEHQLHPPCTCDRCMGVDEAVDAELAKLEEQE